jgi:hypothetical protein
MDREMENEVCKNCGRAIGKLEQAFVYKNQVICKQCNEKLRDEPGQTQSHSGNQNMAESQQLLRFMLACWSIFCIILVISVVIYYNHVRETSEFAYDAPITKIGAIAAIIGKVAKVWFLVPLLLWYLGALPLFIGSMLVKKNRK